MSIQFHLRGGSTKLIWKEYITDMVVVYTGEGKGKTTAALGLAIRAVGYGKKILIAQFGKNSFSGEIKALKKFGPQIKFLQGGKGFVGILGDKKPFREHQEAAQLFLNKLSEKMVSGKWDVIIADEIIGAISGKLLVEQQVLDLINLKPKDVDLVLTGRGASLNLIDKVDLVSEMKAIKHPFQQGFKAKKGIDL